MFFYAMQSAKIDLAATTANQVVVAAPGAGKQIWVYGLSVAMAAAGSVSFQDEDDTAITGVIPLATGVPVCISPSGNLEMPIFKVATNKALECDVLGTSATADGLITYAIVKIT